MQYLANILLVTIKNLVSIWFIYDSKIVFYIDFYPHNKPEFEYNTSIFHLKRFLLFWFQYYCDRGYKFSHIYEINITTISNERFMSYEIYRRQPMQMVELNLIMIASKNPLPISALDRSINQSSIRNCGNFPFNIQQDGRLAPAYFSQEYKNFDQHLPS